MAEFTVTRVYKVVIPDEVLKHVPPEHRNDLIDTCTRQADIGDNRQLYLYGPLEDSYWGDVNDGSGSQELFGPVDDWRATEEDVNID